MKRSSPPTEMAADLPLSILGRRCQQETKRFWQRLPADPAFCHALFGLALANPQAESSKEAWQQIHRIYHPQVVIWVKGHPVFPATGLEPETLADLALERMWVSFALSPEKYGRFPQDDADKALRALLRFLQTCVNSAVMKALTTPSPPLPESLPQPEPEPIDQAAFWRCIYQRLPDDKEKLLVDASFVSGLKPRQILALYPDLFGSIEEIYRLKENILARFKRDAVLSHCLERAAHFQVDAR